jgi:putative SOS response-associated peptidase YedK
MPAVLHPDTYEAWLNYENQDTNALQKILTEKTVTDFKFIPVSKQVNSVKINDPSNIAPVSK